MLVSSTPCAGLETLCHAVFFSKTNLNVMKIKVAQSLRMTSSLAMFNVARPDQKKT